MSKRDSETILEKIRLRWPSSMDIPKTKVIRVVEIDEKRRLFIAESFRAIGLGGEILPYVEDENLLRGFSSVTVDVGAIRHVCNGADVMRPGIVNMASTFERDEIVGVKEQKTGKFIAVGLGIISQKEVKMMPRGPVIRTLHYIGDKFWDAARQVH